jgi:hypothetical protein
VKSVNDNPELLAEAKKKTLEVDLITAEAARHWPRKWFLNRPM